MSAKYKYHWYKYTLLAIMSVFFPPFEISKHNHYQDWESNHFDAHNKYLIEKEEYDEITVYNYIKHYTKKNRMISAEYKYHWYKYTLLAIMSVFSPPFQGSKHDHHKIENPIMLMSIKKYLIEKVEYDGLLCK